jgi:hypothetical protein
MKKFWTAVCGIAQDQTLRANILANSTQNSKIFLGVNLGPKDNGLTKKTKGQKSRDTVPLSAGIAHLRAGIARLRVGIAPLRAGLAHLRAGIAHLRAGIAL